MTVLTALLFQNAYPDFIHMEKYTDDHGLHADCYLLNQDKSIHRLLFDGTFSNEKALDDTVQAILNYKHGGKGKDY